MSFRLIYSPDPAPDLDVAELEEMLSESRIRNRARGITGVLAFVDGALLQIHEGEKGEVLDLLQTFERAPRHSGLRVFQGQEADERAFASWSVAYLSPSTAADSRWGHSTMPRRSGASCLLRRSEPGRLPAMVVNIIKAIAAS